MAIASAFDRARLVNSARAIIAANYGQLIRRGGVVSLSVAALGAGAQLRGQPLYNSMPGLDGPTAAGIVRSALSSMLAAQRMEANRGAPSGTTGLPVVASLYGSTDRYQYHALVRIVDPIYGDSTRPVAITSNAQMSADQIEAFVRANNVVGGSPRGSQARPLANSSALGYVDSVTVIAALRTR